MFGGDVNAREILDRLVPVPAGGGDWGAVLRGAQRARRPRRLRIGAAAAIAVAFVAVAIVALLAPSRHGSSVVDRALAAIGDGPVLHIVLRDTTPRWTTVDLATGRHDAAYQEIETWSDPERGSHWILRVDGNVINDSVWGRPITDPALTAFVNGYRSALEDGRARDVGNGEVDGTKVQWLEFRSESGGGEEVAVDAETYAPVAIRWVAHDTPGPLTKVLEIETEPAGAGDFAPAERKPYPTRGDVVSSEVIDRARAQGQLRTPVLWPGPRVAGLDFSLARADEWKVVLSGDEAASIEGKGIRLAYTAPGAEHPSLRLSESSYPAFAYGWEPSDPGPKPGTMRIKAFRAVAGSLGGDMYQGELRRDGTYVVFQGESEEQIVTAARALEPMP